MRRRKPRPIVIRLAEAPLLYRFPTYDGTVLSEGEVYNPAARLRREGRCLRVEVLKERYAVFDDHVIPDDPEAIVDLAAAMYAHVLLELG